MLYLLLTALIIVSAAACGGVEAARAPAATLEPASTTRSLTVDGLERSYVLHIPAGLESGSPVPLVFVFHGFQESANSIRLQSGMDQAADAGGFIVVYPNGSGPSSARSWNASGCCGTALQNDVDDQEFVRQIIVDVGTIAAIDPKRIYASGFSNGALLSFRLACDMAEVFAAVAPVGGVLVTDPCRPAEPVSVLQVHGMSDAAVPYEGGQNPLAAVRFPPTEEALAVWVALDGCSPEPQVEQNGIVTRKSFTGCQPGISVELYLLDGIAHSWPSPYVTDPSITEVISAFFAAHPKP
jgi:polyhydroxybutyrate depolymerase